MLIRFFALIWAGLFFATSAAQAQQPLSAIDWLSDSLSKRERTTTSEPDSDIARTATPDTVSVSGIDAPSLDGVGLLPTSVTGLPKDLWGQSRAADLASQIQATPINLLPAMQSLLFTLLTAELDPAFDSGPNATLYLARLDTLLKYGALDQVQSLLEHSGQNQPNIFRRAFDVSLLTHTEDRACTTLRQTPALSPTFPARIFCLARGGDWDAAALSLETGRALGFLTNYEDALLARFLDPILFEGEPSPSVPTHPSPLVFRLLEAIGEPIPTTILPLAFAHADLSSNTGWKPQIEAVERLVRTGALDPNQLLGLYSERRASASGGIWDRVAAVQKLDAALADGDLDAVSELLSNAWAQMVQGELEIAFANLMSHRLSGLQLTPELDNLRFEIGLLTKDYEDVANAISPTNDRQSLLISIARGQPGDLYSADALTAAIQDGFRAGGIPVRLQSLTGNDRLGEAILRAITLTTNGAQGDLDELTDALAFFRAVGLEDTARRAALQILLLERRG